MHIDCINLRSGSVQEHDVAIIGAGAAGITLARQFYAHPNISVALLESGSFFPEGPTTELYQGRATGTVLDEPNGYLTETRLRFFGGSTMHWSGWCHPLEEIDLEKRSWVPHSGWSIPHQELRKYFHTASSILEIKDFDEPELHSDHEHPLLLESSNRVRSSLLYKSPPTRFGIVYKKKMLNQKNVTLYTHANVLDIGTNEHASEVTSLKGATLSGNTFEVKAKLYILATGGIENARLLLASNSVQKAGLGNEHDLVGRFFMEHIEIPNVADVFVTAENPSTKFYDRFEDSRIQQIAYGILKLSAETEKQEKLLNSSFYFSKPERESMLSHFDQHVLQNVNYTDHWRSNKFSPAQPYIGKLKARAEQSPNPNSRVQLMHERDALGVPKAHLDWQLLPIDKHSVRRSAKIIAKEFGAHSQGRLRIRLDETDEWPVALGGAHHMGTTRMHEDAKQGVVDSNCKVHSLSNMYVAGSSVFPTAGFANPTYNIVALTLRLADHLKEELAI